MENAIGMVNIMLERKTSWNAKDLALELASICNTARFSSVTAATQFSQACCNFDCYIRDNNITSIGRNQFKAWFITGELNKLRGFTFIQPMIATQHKELPKSDGVIANVKFMGETIPTPIPKVMLDNTPPWEEPAELAQNASEGDEEDLKSKCERLETENRELKRTLHALQIIVSHMESSLKALKALLGVQ